MPSHADSIHTGESPVSLEATRVQSATRGSRPATSRRTRSGRAVEHVDDVEQRDTLPSWHQDPGYMTDQGLHRATTAPWLRQGLVEGVAQAPNPLRLHRDGAKHPVQGESDEVDVGACRRQFAYREAAAVEIRGGFLQHSLDG